MQAVMQSFWLNFVKRGGKMSSLKFEQSFLKMSSKSFAEPPFLKTPLPNPTYFQPLIFNKNYWKERSR